MTAQDIAFIDKHLKNISLRNIITLVICTATSVATVLGVYYGFKTEQAIMKIEIKILEQRINKLENVKTYALVNTKLPA